jgi:hypothetical protein
VLEEVEAAGGLGAGKAGRLRCEPEEVEARQDEGEEAEDPEEEQAAQAEDAGALGVDGEAVGAEAFGGGQSRQCHDQQETSCAPPALRQ